MAHNVTFSDIFQLCVNLGVGSKTLYTKWTVHIFILPPDSKILFKLDWKMDIMSIVQLVSISHAVSIFTDPQHTDWWAYWDTLISL